MKLYSLYDELSTLIEDRNAQFKLLLKGSKVPLITDETGNVTLILGDASDDDHNKILTIINKLLDPNLKKYEKWVVQQVSSGSLPVDKIEEDIGRINKALLLFVKLSRKKSIWKGSTNIFDYKNWRRLEQIIDKYVKEAPVKTKTEDKNEHSLLIHQKSYRNEVLALLYSPDREIPTRTFYIRRVFTPEGACTYGRGTHWCTTTPIKKRNLIDSEEIKKSIKYNSYQLNNENAWNHNESMKNILHQVMQSVNDYNKGKSPQIMNPAYYLGTAMSYITKGLYIIEVSNNESRKPIIQVSGTEIMEINDIYIKKFGNLLSDFIKEVVAYHYNKIDEVSLKTLSEKCTITKSLVQ